MNKTETIELVTPAQPEASADAQGVVFLVAAVLFLLGAGLAVAGVYCLWGTGWALLTAAPAPIVLAVILFKGLTRGG